MCHFFVIGFAYNVKNIKFLFKNILSQPEYLVKGGAVDE